MTRVQALFAAAAAAIGIGLWFAFNSTADALQGEYSRIINVHVPSFWVAFVAFGVTAVGSVAWLRSKKSRWDRLAASSAEIGTLFSGIGLFTGMVWGEAVWGRAWDWGDTRLATTAVMFFVYLGYLALRKATPDPLTRARRSSILGVIAVIQIPLVYFSVNLFRTLHQTQSIRPDGSTMPDEMLMAMGINVLAFTVLYIALLSARIEVASAEATAASQPRLASDGVTPPRFNEVEDV
jgi:heme exporter protein C